MKKLIALMLCLVLALSMSVTAFAEGEQTGTTTISAEVPEASYTIHIPADTTLEYGNTSEQTIGGSLYVSDVTNVNTRIICNATGSALKNGSNYIPIVYLSKNNQQSTWNTYTVSGESENLFGIELYPDLRTIEFKVRVDNWTAAPGTYTATMTFNFSIA